MKPFLSISLKNSFQIILRFVVGLLNMKIVALFAGTSGMALFGQLQNALQLGSTLSGLGLSNGVVKFTSKYKNDVNERDSILSTGFSVTFLMALVVGISIFFLADYISFYLFKSTQYAHICQFVGIHFISGSIFNLVLAVFNGLLRLKEYVFLNVVNSTSFLMLVYIFTIVWNIEGMLWALVFQNVIACSIAVLVVSKRKIRIRFSIKKKACFKLGNYTIMTLASGIIGPLILLLVREIIIVNEGMHLAGIWESVNKISNSYIALMTGAFAYYFLPRFSQLKSHSSISEEVYSTYKTLVPILILGGLLLYVFRGHVVDIIYTKSFSEASDIMIWQIFGDFFRILSWLIGYLLIAKTKTVAFVCTELLSAVLQVFLTKVLVNQFGIEGSTMAYGLENVIYFIFMIFVFYWYWGRFKD